jgi:flagellar basal body-associated protein FliL
MPAEQEGKNGKKGKLIIVIAVVVLAAFAVLIAYMMLHLESDETTWTRALYLYGGVEAIAFAAAGFLFGKEVSREQVDKAENQAESARQDSRQAQQQANDAQQKAATSEAKTRHIVAAVQAQAAGQTQQSKAYGMLGVPKEQTDAVQAALQQLVQTVDGIDRA